MLDAFNTYHHYQDVPLSIAAALCAAADHVVPERGEPVYGECDYEVCDVVIHLDQQRIRSQLLAIAAELEQAASINTTEAQ